MNTAIVTIAKSIDDVLGVVGAESLLLRSIILSHWSKPASEMADKIIEACFNFDRGEVRGENADGILNQYRLKLGDDFIEAVVEEMPMVINAAYDKGRSYLVDRMMSGVFLAEKKISDDIIANLSYITGSKKESIYSTLSRWFREYQGKYFDRFIIPETSRLMSYAGTVEGKIDTMRSIGQRYRDFVEADGYWSAVSEYNAETSKIFSQVQLLQEMNISNYRIEAVLDERTCAVCEFLHGTEWETVQAVERMQDMIIAEADNVAEVNPFPSRSTPKDFEDPQESGYMLPPFHPRCRCNIVTTSSVALSPQAIPTSGGVPIRPTDNSLTNVFTTHVLNSNKNDIESIIREITALSGSETQTAIDAGLVRVLNKAEYSRVKSAFNAIPYELRKWAVGNKKDYKLMALGETTDIPSRVIGNVIQINEKYLKKGIDPAVIQHELRHALINGQIIDSTKGAKGVTSIWDALTIEKTKFKMPIHVNNMYKLNGGRGELAARAAVDEFYAMIGDYYKPKMSFDKLVKAIQEIEVEKTAGSLATDYSLAGRWTASEAKKAAKFWWDTADIDNYTLMSKKQLLAAQSYKPSDAAVQRIAYENELRLREIFKSAGIKKAEQLGDHEPFDVWIGGDAVKYYSGPGYKKYMPKEVIEIKTIVRAKNDKITMHSDSLARKKEELSVFIKGTKGKTQGHTVVFDERTGKIYYRNGLGSFRLSSMQEVTENELVKIFGGNPKITETPVVEKLVFNPINNKRDFYKFQDAMGKVKEEHKKYLTWYDWEEYKKEGVKLYLAEDGSTGYGITKDNTLISLFSVEGSSNGQKAIKDAIARGANNLECFDGKLPTIYSKYGFTVVERYPWDDSLAPINWDYTKRGKPDFIVMKKGPIGRINEAPPSIEKVPIFDSSKIKNKDPLSEEAGKGVNGSYIIQAKTGPKGKLEKYLFKPVDEEVFLKIQCIDEIANGSRTAEEFVSWLGGLDELAEQYGINSLDDPILSSIGTKAQAGSLAKREALAYNIFRELKDRGAISSGIYVPETHYVYSGDKIVGVAVKWDDEVEDFIKYFSSQGGSTSRLMDKYWDIVDMGDTYDMAVFDYIIGNTDRHLDNILVNNSSGRLVLIDHGYSFPSAELSGKANGLSEFRNMILARGANQGLDDYNGLWDKRRWIQVLEDIDWKNIAEEFNLNDSETSALITRVEDMKKVIWNDRMEQYFNTYASVTDHMYRGSFNRSILSNLTYEKPSEWKVD